MSLRGRTALIVAGAGMNLSTYGIGVWGDSVLLSSGSFVGPALAALSDTYLLFSALGLFGALIARVIIAVASGATIATSPAGLDPWRWQLHYSYPVFGTPQGF